MEQEKQLTYGEKMVGLTFNPSGDDKVLVMKKQYALIIDCLKKELDNEPTYGVEGDPAMRVYSKRGQLLEQAIMEAITAQMWAVKAITFTN